MKHFLYAAALAVGLATLSVAPAQARNYDCSKPGNATKAVCKSATKDANKAIKKTAPAKASAPKASSTRVSSATTTKTTTERNYDCTKPGNKNKAVCKSAPVSPAKPIVKEATTTKATRNYDCSKPGNTNKTVCKTSVAARPAPKVVRTAAPRQAAPAPTMAAGSGPNGATAACKDGTYSHAKEHRGACSHHGGVAKWL